MGKYLKNLLRHKWFVFIEACKLGVPLLGIIHDMSKFLPDEFFSYARYDFSDDGNNDDKERADFDLAWLKHQRRNKHHWQHWLLMNDSGIAHYDEWDNCPCWMKQVEPLPMPDRYIREMVADWKGAGRAYGNPDTVGWYMKNMNKIILHPETEKKVLKYLGMEVGRMK